MKKIVVVLFTVSTLIFCLFTGCKENSVNTLNSKLKNFEITLPEETQILYEYSDIGWFGEGQSYYVVQTEKALSIIEGINSHITKEEFNKKYKSFTNLLLGGKEFDESRLADISGGYYWAFRFHNVNDNEVYLIKCLDSNCIYIGFNYR